jgi:hypothetical protein
MATWCVWVKATRDGQQRFHASYSVKADSAEEARRNAVAQAERGQLSYRDCQFSSTTAEKIRDN